MSKASVLKLGIVGACGRGSSFRKACDALSDCVSLQAVCDINAEGLDKSAELLGAKEKYTDYEAMLDKAGLDAVIIGTPMHLHVPQAIAALNRNISVLSEVTAGVSIEECRELVLACDKSKGIYMMAENYTYMQANAIVRELVRQGLFGTSYYAEAEYIHELKHMNEYQTPWRRQWQTGVEGVTYGTHSLGPVLQWFPGDRVTRVCCEAAGSRHTDNTGKPYCEACSTMLCKTANDALIKIRVDMVSDRPHNMTNYQLQGTDGCYESARAHGEKNRIWLRKLCRQIEWVDLDAFAKINELVEKYYPPMWLKHGEAAAKAGHGGGDYFEVLDFVDAVRGIRPPEIGIHEAMDMTLPGLVSQQSILQDGAWLPVPDSRTWVSS